MTRYLVAAFLVLLVAGTSTIALLSAFEPPDVRIISVVIPSEVCKDSLYDVMVELKNFEHKDVTVSVYYGEEGGELSYIGDITLPGRGSGTYQFVAVCRVPGLHVMVVKVYYGSALVDSVSRQLNCTSCGEGEPPPSTVPFQGGPLSSVIVPEDMVEGHTYQMIVYVFNPMSKTSEFRVVPVCTEVQISPVQQSIMVPPSETYPVEFSIKPLTGGTINITVNLYVGSTIIDSGTISVYVHPNVTPTTTPPPTTTQPPTGTPTPMFDFDVEVQPKNIILNPGEEVGVQVLVTLLSGSPAPVSLSVSGVPPGFTASLGADSITPPGSTVLTIRAGDTPGFYRITVEGVSGKIHRAAALLVEVKEKEKRCIIATVTYGSELSREVQLLRRFRDRYVSKTFLGSCFLYSFNKFYYSWSPHVAALIVRSPVIHAYSYYSLQPLIYTLTLAERLSQKLGTLNPEAAILLIGGLESILLGVIYLAPTLTLLAVLGVKTGRTFRIALLTFTACFAASVASLLLLSEWLASVSTFLLAATGVVLGGLLPSTVKWNTAWGDRRLNSL